MRAIPVLKPHISNAAYDHLVTATRRAAD